MLRKILALAIVLLFLGRLLVLPRFRGLRQKLDRVINATLLALVVVFGIQLLRYWTASP